MSRKGNSARNAVAGLIKTVIGILFPFVIRTIIIKHLGTQFAGLSGLFTSILSVLNLAELGISSAIIFNMYKPIANGDTETVKALLGFYKRVYRVIGIMILAIGVSITPLIQNLINGTWPETINIYWLYLLYLLGTSVSYFVFAEKSALLTALQRVDIVDTSFLVVQLCFYCVEILILVLTKNFYYYVMASIVKTIVCNFVTAVIANRKYPEYVGKGKVSTYYKKEIKKQVSSLLIGKIGDVSRNALDSIIISALFGLTSVTLYGNYYYVFSALYAFILVLSRAMTASIGDSIAKESVERNRETFDRLYFVFNWIITFCTVCLFCLYQRFIELWLGDDFLLPMVAMAQFCIYFYMICSNCIRNNFIDGNGLWEKLKLSYILEAVANLVLNVLLGYLLGISGVLLATIITIFFFNYVSRTNILFGEYFKSSPREFYRKSFSYLIILIVVGGLTYGASLLNFASGVLGFVVSIAICVVVSNFLLFIFYRRSPYYKWAFSVLKSIVKRQK